ncbi:MAG: Flagellar FliJ protein [Pseudomonadota bacterium]|jgi:flagellar export protein FliJ
MKQTTWTVLAEKAQSAVRDAQQLVSDARHRVSKLEQSLAHLDQLRDDYIARYSEAQKEAHSISDTITYRKFLEHLRGLRGRVEGQLQDANLKLADAKAELVKALREQAKMDAMVERDKRNQALAIAKQEQREMDEAGLRLFNAR